MRILLYIIILAAMLFAPVDRLDIAKLEPVEAVAVYMDREEVVLETDTGSRGRGATAAEALQNMKDNALSVIYLDTADYLLIADGAENEAAQLRQYLKDSVKIGRYAGVNVKDEARYLDVHADAAKPTG